MARDRVREIVESLTKEAADKGHIIEVGWIGYHFLVMGADASVAQAEEARRAFYSGAQHLFASVMTMLEEGQEPTEKDLQRMSNINDELNEFVKKMKERGTKL